MDVVHLLPTDVTTVVYGIVVGHFEQVVIGTFVVPFEMLVPVLVETLWPVDLVAVLGVSVELKNGLS